MIENQYKDINSKLRRKLKQAFGSLIEIENRHNLESLEKFVLFLNVTEVVTFVFSKNIAQLFFVKKIPPAYFFQNYSGQTSEIPKETGFLLFVKINL